MTSQVRQPGIEFMIMQAAVPKPGPGEVLLKVNMASIHGTDVEGSG